jgi:hypothetical protein
VSKHPFVTSMRYVVTELSMNLYIVVIQVGFQIRRRLFIGAA